jgi:hypothetical protein
MKHAGDLDSQSEKLNRIRSLMLTPEFTVQHDRMTSVLHGNMALHERLRFARACMICGSPTLLPVM